MADAHKNFAYTTVTTAPSPATSGTSVTVADGSVFPAVPFNATVWPVGVQPVGSNAEIVRVTNIATNVLTITRAQESSSARTVVVGDQIAATVTAKTLTDVEALPDVQAFTATGTWTKPTGASRVQVIAIGSGGGGGSGRRGAASTLRGGGGGGGAGNWVVDEFNAADLTATVAVTIPAGGTGGTIRSVDSTNGVAGGSPAATTFGAYVSAAGGPGGGAGTNVIGGAGGAGTDQVFADPNLNIGSIQAAGGTGSAGAADNTVGGSGSISSPGGGGGGGGLSAGNARDDGKAGGGGGGISPTTNASKIAGGAAGTGSSGSGVAGAASGTSSTSSLTGGAGGGAGAAGNAGGLGRAGGLWGAGGGGGGGSTNGSSAGGTGGDGAKGYVVVVSW